LWPRHGWKATTLPVSSAFTKSEFVFNLHRAAAAGQQTALVVEGFFDCLKLHQAGVPAVVALMGAALYDSQQRALPRHFRSVILILDGDTARRRALRLPLPLTTIKRRLTSSLHIRRKTSSPSA
jgi:DNA primase